MFCCAQPGNLVQITKFALALLGRNKSGQGIFRPIAPFGSYTLPRTNLVAPNSRPTQRQPGKFLRSSRLVQFCVRYSARFYRSIISIFLEEFARDSEKRSASKVPRREETPGEPRKKSMTRTRGSFSVRSASRIFCAVCVANISRFVLSVTFKMESSDWQPALAARHAKTTMATIANLDCLCSCRSEHQMIAPAKTERGSTEPAKRTSKRRPGCRKWGWPQRGG